MGNIVKAVVGKNGKIIKTAPLYQYDYGQILQIEGIELPAAYQVHFSNDPMGDSTTSIGDESGVTIPDTYLASGETVYAWLFLHTGEDDGETVLNIVIPVRQRAAITNETPTPQQQGEIDQIIEELNEAVDAAEDAQAAAEEAAEQAEAQVEKYPVIVDGYWAFWDEASEQYVKSNQKAQGPKGDPGDPGDPSSLIDDAAAAAGKTYSSSKIEAELTPLKSALTISDIKETLLTGDIPGTTKTVTMGSDGNPVSIVHSNGNEAVRTDAFVWGENTVTETRTLASGKYITIQTNLITLETIVSAVQEVA